MTSEEQYARRLAGAHNEKALEEAARHLHYNESLHMHQRVEDKEPCGTCLIRAARAIWALRTAGTPIVTGPDPVQTDGPVEVEAGVLHALEAAACTGDRGEVQGWRVESLGEGRVPWSKRLMVIRSQDNRHYGVRLVEFTQADPAARIVCQPVTARYEVTQTARFELSEAVARG